MPLFEKGNKFGKGNPHGGKVAALRVALFEELTPEQLRKLIRRFIRIAHDERNLKEARQAGELLLAYAIGKPKESIEVEVSGSTVNPSLLSDQELSEVLSIVEVAARRVEAPALPEPGIHASIPCIDGHNPLADNELASMLGVVEHTAKASTHEPDSNPSKPDSKPGEPPRIAQDERSTPKTGQDPSEP